MKKLLVPAALAAGLAASARADDFAKAVTFTASGYQGAAALADFPVLVKLSAAIEGFDYADVGADTNLVFKDAGGTVLPHEIDTWDTNDVSLVWVRVPALTNATSFTMYYGGSAAAAANDPASVWTAADYVGVWHMDEPDGAVADATGHGLSATPAGDATVSVRYAGDAPVGHARQTGTSDANGYLSVADYDSFGVGNTFTVSGWVRLASRSGSTRIFSRKTGYKTTDGWEIEMGNGSDTAFQVRGAARDQNTCAGAFSPGLQGRWTHVALVYDGSSCSVYSNGFLLVAGTVTPAEDNGLPFSIGCDSDGDEAYVRGAFDECRLRNAAASADWIAAEYATAASDAFLAAGPVTDVAPTLGAVAVDPASTKATLSGTIVSPGAGATACDVWLALGTSAGVFGEAVQIASGAADSFTHVIPGLSPKTTYYYELSVTNNATPATGAATTGSFTTEARFDYLKKVEFTVNATNANGLAALPVLVRLSADSPAGFAYRDCAPDGSDIRFFDAAGKEIPFEIDTWDPSGESVVWVKVPSPAQGTTFTMFYKGTPGKENDPRAVWSDYTGVWHLGVLAADDPATWQSQGVYSNSTAAAGLDGHLSTNSVPGEAGRFGKSFRVNDSTGPSAGNYNEGGVWVDDAGADSPLDAGGVFTISGWFKHADWNFQYDRFFYKRLNEDNTGDPNGSFIAFISSNTKTDTRVCVRGATGSYRVRFENADERKYSMIDNWVYLTVVFDGTTCSIYENGEHCRTASLGVAASDNDAPLVFGNNVAVADGRTGKEAWNGWIDEVRYLKGAKSAEWIAAEYAAMADDSFLAAGAVENIGRATVIIVR